MMVRPSPEAVEQWALISRMYPHAMEWLNSWRQQELEQLPNAIGNAALSQGRCQVLNELYKLITESPDSFGKAKQAAVSNAHRF